MASTPEPEVQFAQKLASNEKSVRTKAIKKLRKYINVRSQNSTGFTSDDLLKLWKGLFYCLWMQDKPLLQAELSKQISTLIHSFHDSDGQFLYLESFLQTFKREWTGIDRLRMDKFFQLVRFMFRQTFELLKKTNWEMSMVSKFLQLLVAQLLHSGSAAPSGLQFHILDLYMTELAAVGSAELTADQNLMFIEPFCKTAARTKDHTLFSAICNSIFSTIIDQAPFAIEDLMKEMKTANDLESDASSEDHEDKIKKKTLNLFNKQKTVKQIIGRQVNKKGKEDDNEQELLHLDSMDTVIPDDEDIGPVLQFNYTDLSEKLLELSCRSTTSSQNRQRLYKIIKVLRDLGEGIFPQDEYPEEVSTDEDDEMFGSRKRLKRRGGHMEEDEEGSSAAKKSKGKKKETSRVKQQTEELGKDDRNHVTLNFNHEKKKKKKKNKAGKSQISDGEGNTERGQTISKDATSEAKRISQHSQEKGSEKLAFSSTTFVKVTEAASSQGQSGLLLSESKNLPLVTEQKEISQTKHCTSYNKDQSENLSKKKKRHSHVLDPRMETPEGGTLVFGKRDKSQRGGTKTQSQAITEAEIKSISLGASGPMTKTSKIEFIAHAKKNCKKKRPKADVSVEREHIYIETASKESQLATAIPLRNTNMHEGSSAFSQNTITQLKNKTKKNLNKPGTTVEEETPQVGNAEKLLFGFAMKTPKNKKSLKLTGSQKTKTRDETQLQVVGTDEPEVVSSSRNPTKKRRKIPVVFEFEANELEAASSNGITERTATKKIKLGNKIQKPNSESKKVTFGLKNNKTTEFRKTDRSLLVSPDGSSRVAFDPKQRPKFGVLKAPIRTLSTTIRKTPNTMKTSLNAPKSTPKQRPSAVDFF
ncbi:ribosomal RNA processing protein 1 homolog B isoform X2 [Echeneis naucrates]|uniref:ribosomal RNA processing protein 1 homolog B isoform X2 n=1 Tax=Echeneis naucrates TaxID=173247 RepID=UPI0011142756|nr:ribosomal RNA processing protein 1 homolog B isoform X2 [Echeneis naucrates]